jgi:catechol 2,3-dioxygenase-like lactoylglutathione lyase family enzyme
MLDHIGIGVTDVEECKRFWLQALAPLGISIVMEGPYGVGLGRKQKPFFCIFAAPEKPAPLHLGFAAKSRTDVDDVYRAALGAGGTDNGPPGLRPHCHPDDYGAFVIGPDGHNVEAVCHMPSTDQCISGDGARPRNEQPARPPRSDRARVPMASPVVASGRPASQPIRPAPGNHPWAGATGMSRHVPTRSPH